MIIIWPRMISGGGSTPPPETCPGEVPIYQQNQPPIEKLRGYPQAGGLTAINTAQITKSDGVLVDEELQQP